MLMVTDFMNLCGRQMLLQDPKVSPEEIRAWGYLESVFKKYYYPGQ